MPNVITETIISVRQVDANGDPVSAGGSVSSSTGTHSNVGDETSATTLLAANANRDGATVYNDSTADLYLKLGSGASSTSFTVKLAQDDYYEVPFGYTGIITGLWASDASGNARVVEFT